jgi:trk system potassium uptake protein TrkH
VLPVVFLRRLVGDRLHPAQLVVSAFVALILVGTVLLRLPIAIDPGQPNPGWVNALFQATSASTVTGLGTVDISVFSLFGELVILALIQLGGFGIMTIGSVLALLIVRHLGLRQRMLAQAEIGAVDMGELRFLIAAIAKITLGVEGTIAAILVIPILRADDKGVVEAVYSAIFHAVSGFNNAGISLYSDSLTRFVANPFVVFPVSTAFIIGGLGFPILVEFRKRVRPRRWSLHTRITLMATAVLLVVGPLTVLMFEWDNESTLGQLDIWGKLQAAWFQGTTPRTAGFNTVDIGALHEPTQLVLTGLMFIGAGPASTSGGIKVTTFAVLFYVMWSEVRGDEDINAFRRRLPVHVVRQALTVALLSVAVVFGTAMALTALSQFDFTQTLFESASAFGTVGLSTGITAALPDAGQLLLVLVMLAGRVGPVTFVTALAFRQTSRAYRYAEERPIIG